MGIWAEIKHAINSTLGTTEFKPLDQIILGQKRFVASDDILMQTKKVFGYNTEQNVVSIIPKLDGILNIQLHFTTTANTSNSIRIYKDDELIDTWNIQTYSNSTSSAYNPVKALTIAKDSKYTFTAASSAGSLSFTFYIKGTTRDDNFIQVV